MGDLYTEIKRLVNRQEELDKLNRYFIYDPVFKEKRVTSYMENKASQYLIESDEISKKLRNILDNCRITPLKLAEIISEKEGTEYVLKIFREKEKRNSMNVYTGNFVACYLNDKNKYFAYDKDGLSFEYPRENGHDRYINYSLPTAEYQELLASLKGNPYIVATDQDCGFKPEIAPSHYLKNANFTNCVVYGYVDNFVSTKFADTVNNYVKEYLQGIDAESIPNEEDTLNM